MTQSFESKSNLNNRSYRRRIVSVCDFNKRPPCGTYLIYDKQRYVCIGYGEERALDGRMVPLVRWKTYCVDCGEEFIATTRLKQPSMIRRCQKHRNQGKPAAGENQHYKNAWKKRGRLQP